MGLQVFDLHLVGGQPGFHVAWDLVDVQGTVAIAQDFLGAVVTRYNHVTVLGIEDVINGAVQHLGVHLDMSEFHFSGDGGQ